MNGRAVMRFHAFTKANGEMFFINGGLSEPEALIIGEKQGAVTYLGLVDVKITMVRRPSSAQKRRE